MKKSTKILPIKTYLIFIFSIFILLSACDNDDNGYHDDDIHTDDDLTSEYCDLLAFEDEAVYELGSEFQFTITDVEMEDHCLIITVNYSGCEEDISAILVDEGVIMESFPEQRNVKFIVTTDVTACLPDFSNSFSFNLMPLRIHETGQINFNLDGYPNQILYTY